MLELINIAKHYGPPERATPVLRGVSFTLEAGAFCA